MSLGKQLACCSSMSAMGQWFDIESGDGTGIYTELSFGHGSTDVAIPIACLSGESPGKVGE